MSREKKGKLAPELPRRKFFHAKYFPEIPLDLKKTSFLKGKVQFSFCEERGVWYYYIRIEEHGMCPIKGGWKN